MTTLWRSMVPTFGRTIAGRDQRPVGRRKVVQFQPAKGASFDVEENPRSSDRSRRVSQIRASGTNPRTAPKNNVADQLARGSDHEADDLDKQMGDLRDLIELTRLESDDSLLNDVISEAQAVDEEIEALDVRVLPVATAKRCDPFHSRRAREPSRRTGQKC